MRSEGGQGERVRETGRDAEERGKRALLNNASIMVAIPGECKQSRDTDREEHRLTHYHSFPSTYSLPSGKSPLIHGVNLTHALSAPSPALQHHPARKHSGKVWPL